MVKSNPNPKKIEQVQKLAEMISKAKSVVFVDYTGLTVKTQQALKKALKESGGEMLVAKNTLIQLAMDQAQIAKGLPQGESLQGQTALIFADADPVAPIQVLGKFAGEFSLPKMKIAIVEGIFQDHDNLVKISNLPSKSTLLGQALGSISSPLYGLVGTLQGNLQKLIFILEQVKGASPSEVLTKGGES